MPLETIHNVERGTYRLLHSPRDIDGGTPVPDRAWRLDDASESHQKLFERYRSGYQFFYPRAESWWTGCVAAQETGGRPHEQAIAAAFEMRLAGPASLPEFVWFVRHFWLLCDDLNQTVALDQRVAPQHLLVQWLADAGEQDAITLITCMPYWPLGLDEHGQWC